MLTCLSIYIVVNIKLAQISYDKLHVGAFIMLDLTKLLILLPTVNTQT